MQSKFDTFSPFIHDLSFILGKAQKYVLYLGLNPKSLGIKFFHDQADPCPPPSPLPLQSVFRDHFVHLNLDYDYMCCEADFT